MLQNHTTKRLLDYVFDGTVLSANRQNHIKSEQWLWVRGPSHGGVTNGF